MSTSVGEPEPGSKPFYREPEPVKKMQRAGAVKSFYRETEPKPEPVKTPKTTPRSREPRAGTENFFEGAGAGKRNLEKRLPGSR